MSGRFSFRSAFFVLAGVNLCLLGLAAGGLAAGVRIAREAPSAVQSPPGGFERGLFAALPPESRRLVRRAVAQAWLSSQEERRAARLARREVARQVGAEPYEPEAVEAALARLQAAEAVLVRRVHGAIADALSELPADQRRAAIRAALRVAQAGAGGARGAGLRDEPGAPGPPSSEPPPS